MHGELRNSKSNNKIEKDQDRKRYVDKLIYDQE